MHWGSFFNRKTSELVWIEIRCFFNSPSRRIHFVVHLLLPVGANEQCSTTLGSLRITYFHVSTARLVWLRQRCDKEIPIGAVRASSERESIPKAYWNFLGKVLEFGGVPRKTLYFRL